MFIQKNPCTIYLIWPYSDMQKTGNKQTNKNQLATNQMVVYPYNRALLSV